MQGYYIDGRSLQFHRSTDEQEGIGVLYLFGALQGRFQYNRMLELAA